MLSGGSGTLEARISIRWDSMIWAEGFEPEFRLESGRQVIRLNRLTGNVYPAERVELDLMLYPPKLAESERQELEELRAKVARLEEKHGAKR